MTVPASHSRQPVFIHALFRSGSTYLFQAFRRLGDGYTCFQEPLHEIALNARNDKDILNDPQDSDKVTVLRHPQLSRSYFSELYDVADTCLPLLDEADIYGGYFGSDTDAKGIDYWQCLIEQASGRPIIQECRSAGRIAAMRHRLGGHHIYLWRNPWDQWWSYQVSPYFDLTTQLILNATNPPDFIERLKEHIGFRPRSSQSLEVVYDHFSRRPLSPDHAYQAFYALWLFGLDGADKHAHQLLNIDQLSASAKARNETVKALDAIGVEGFDLGDCHSPVTAFTDAEQTHFRTLEGEIHQLWTEAGLPEERLHLLLALREQSAPDRYVANDHPALVDELSRYRDLVRRRQQELTTLHQESDTQLREGHRREDGLREHLEKTSQQLEQTEQKVDQLEHHTRLHKSAAEALELELSETRELLSQVLQSRSWRLTAPVRHAILFARRVSVTDREHGIVTRTAVRGALRTGVSGVIAVADRHTRRWPRIRHALLAVALRMPWLMTRLRRMRYSPKSYVAGNTVNLTPRSRDIYRQLVAAIDDIKTQQPSKDQDETSH